MEWLQAIFLGLVQGITEFLPISSSGHLILMPYPFGWQDQGLIFDVAVNTGTLVAVIFYFRHEVKDILGGFARSLHKGGLTDNPSGYLAWAVGLATIPVGFAGLLLKDQVATFGRDPMVVAVASIFFGLMLWIADRRTRLDRGLTGLTWRDAVLIGIGQVFALIPGTSRSGVTMTAGLFLGFDRETAARFSFLMAIPVGLLAGGLEFIELLHTKPTLHEWGFMAVGFMVSMFSALLVIRWLMAWVKSRNMTVFVVYRVLLGIIVFIVIY
jgi:undecaprenyl-diphosphatase